MNKTKTYEHICTYDFMKWRKYIINQCKYVSTDENDILKPLTLNDNLYSEYLTKKIRTLCEMDARGSAGRIHFTALKKN
jgi:hypothetical protein